MNSENLKSQKTLFDKPDTLTSLNVSKENSRPTSPNNSVYFPQMPERSERFTTRRNSNIIDLKQIKINSRRRSSIQPKFDLSNSFNSGILNLSGKTETQRLQQKTVDSFNDMASYQECNFLSHISIY